jgi:hypothetical protein
MCPLIAKEGSPWTGDQGSPCPEDEALCAWWTIACSTGGVQSLVESAAAGRPAPVMGPNKPKTYAVRKSKIGSWFDCPKAAVCSWQKQALKSGRVLCPPRDALKRGLDPRICLF